jgi:hypothetical protein
MAVPARHPVVMPTVIANSTFLDAFGANLFTQQQYAEVAAATLSTDVRVQLTAMNALTDLFQYGSVDATISGTGNDTHVTVGLMLDRATSADALLSGNWAQRQSALAAFQNDASLWSTYGADAATYAAVQSQIVTALGSDAALTAASQLGYISTAADRTIWLTLSSSEFSALFGTSLLRIDGGTADHPINALAWTGNLALNDAVTSAAAIKGLWVERSVAITNPAVLSTTHFEPQQGPQGIGNATTDKVTATPAAVAANYNFPLPSDVATGAVALVETNVNNQAALFAAFNEYRQAMGLAPVTQQQFQVVSGTNVAGEVAGELTLDISVVAGAVPNSTQLLYSDLGGTPFNAYQQIFFDSVNNPAVLSSSYPTIGQPTANSPFQWAFQQLFVDGVLANVSVHMAGGDEGASAAIANGIANAANSHSSPYTLLVGGTSIAGLASALADPTLNPADPAVTNLVQLALQNDPATVFQMVEGGLKTLPTNLSAATPGPLGAATQLTAMFETVWQALVATPGEKHHVPVLEIDYGSHQTGSGGVATVTPTPSYQSAFGLGPNGRSLPDVTALSSGDAYYSTLNHKYVNDFNKHHDKQPLLHGNGGTSAASPLWASLTTQFNVIFNDQGLPDLGYYNDLLYTAAVIAPGSFNDIQLGNNINSFYTTAAETGYYNPSLDLFMVPTGHGYAAQPGFDLASGLGSPNGLLLARALSAIAHSQVSFSSSPALLDSDGQGGWQSGADQALLFQTVSPGGDSTVALDLGGDPSLLSSGASGSFAWTSRLAQQSLQDDFDPGLVLLFDKQAQGASSFARVGDNESLSLTIDGIRGQAIQASLSNPFGFADFFAGGDTVRVARPVAVAETVGGQNDQIAVLRMRQGGENELQLTVYKVDDLAGTIGGLAPGHAAYAAAAQGRAYQTVSGDTAITGPGYGQFAKVLLQGIDAGDIIAMKLDNLTTGATYWAFANANESVGGKPVNHLWNYGLNTYGWEDTYGGGDQDYNDMTVQLDFTSAYGRGWLT